MMMVMTHYMELLAVNQPWNLIMYMVIPVALAEALVATEFFTVFLRGANAGQWRIWNKRIGIVLGFYFLGVFLNLMCLLADLYRLKVRLSGRYGRHADVFKFDSVKFVSTP